MAASWRSFASALLVTGMTLWLTAEGTLAQPSNPLRSADSPSRAEPATLADTSDAKPIASASNSAFDDVFNDDDATDTALVPEVRRPPASRPRPTRRPRVDEAVRRASYTTRNSSRPRRRVREASIQVHDDVVYADEIIGEGLLDHEDLHDVFHDAGHVHQKGKGKGSAQKSCCDDICWQCCLPCICLDNIEGFVGVQGFTGPMNRGGSGSFGFYEGFNWGAPVPCFGGALAGQIGLRATQSNLSGANFPGTPDVVGATQIRSDDNRNQIFLTGGIFRRVDWGLQGGLVVDYLSDDWYANTDLVQVRGELSWMFPCTHELGFWFTASTQEDNVQPVLAGLTAPAVEQYESTDLFAFFYRHRSDALGGAEARMFAGFTGVSDGLFGGDVRLPLNADLALQTGFTYLVPQQGNGNAPFGGAAQESWNISLGFVWYPGTRSAVEGDYCRPLFNVADNGSFMIDRR